MVDQPPLSRNLVIIIIVITTTADATFPLSIHIHVHLSPTPSPPVIFDQHLNPSNSNVQRQTLIIAQFQNIIRLLRIDGYYGCGSFPPFVAIYKDGAVILNDIPRSHRFPIV